MKDSRYCIQCGQEIGNEPFCTNPDCKKIPNFYRHVEGPHVSQEKSAAETSGRRAARDPRTRLTPQRDPGAATERRRTIPIRAAPVAALHSTSSAGEKHSLYPGTTEIGARRPAAIIIDHPEVSSEHAAIECQLSSDGGCTLTVVDRASTNGTFVNGERVQRRELKEGDRIRFASAEYEVCFPASEEPRVTVQL